MRRSMSNKHNEINDMCNSMQLVAALRKDAEIGFVISRSPVQFRSSAPANSFECIELKTKMASRRGRPFWSVVMVAVLMAAGDTWAVAKAPAVQ